MKCLSVRQPYAALIAAGIKTREFRRWRPGFLGPLLIAASARANREEILYLGGDPDDRETFPLAVAVCAVDVMRVELDDGGGFAWVFAHPRRVRPFHVRGSLHLFDVPNALVRLRER